MQLPLEPPLKPMLAKRVDALPKGDTWLYEPKWDGFRALVFRDGDEWFLQSRDLKPLKRYFPELEEPVLSQLPSRAVLDGELVIATVNGLDFEALQMRLHPAASRVQMLAEKSPASLVFWDLLCEGDMDLSSEPFAARRARLEKVLADARPPLYLTPVTSDRAVAADWFERFEGAGLDGVMAKPRDGIYEPGKRTMLKVKHKRTVDVVLGGLRWHKNGAGPPSGRCCWDSSTARASYNTSASPQASPRSAASSSPWSSRRSERTPSTRTRGNRGRAISASRA